jgi:hypothetical protein
VAGFEIGTEKGECCELSSVLKCAWDGVSGGLDEVHTQGWETQAEKDEDKKPLHEEHNVRRVGR